tara:strand:+ start:570 stop:1178 length:609 start_codon:yes stop_codon:yes gene_type:complete
MSTSHTKIFFDFETTGLNQFHDRATELAMIKDFSNGQQPQEFNSLVNPEKKISNFITRITGISTEMVADKPTFSQLSSQVFNFIQEPNNTPYLIAHNCDGFDKIILRNHFKRENINTNQYNWRYLDTLLMSKRLYPYFFKHNLKDLMTQLGLETQEAHRAMNDTIMLKTLYYRMCEDLAKEQKIATDYVISHPEYVWDYINN